MAAEAADAAHECGRAGDLWATLSELLAELALASVPPDAEDFPGKVTLAVIGLQGLLRVEFAFPDRDAVVAQVSSLLE